ncbi:autophagy-related protein 13 [Chytriomyces sp. MP71]|nr:autophagy-related protein 13 [Chytriomyces sp. MP71]
MPGLGPVSAHASAGRHATATSTAAPPSAPASTPSPQPSIQPMIIDIYLDLPTSEPILVLKDEATLRRHRFPKDALLGLALDPITGTQFGVKKKRILLESWHLSLMPHSPSNTPSIDVAVMYKRMVAFFRSLYAFVRLLPSYKHFKRHSAFHSSQAPNPSSNPAVSTSPPSRQFPNQLKVGYRLASSRVMPVDEAGLDQLHVPGRTADTHLGIAEYSFSPLETTIGYAFSFR